MTDPETIETIPSPATGFWPRLFAAGGTNTLVLAIGVATGVLTARGLPPHDRGVLIALVTWGALLGTVSLVGLDDALIYHARGSLRRALAYRHGLQAPALEQTVAGMVLTVGLGIAVVRPDSLGGALTVALPVLIVPLNTISVIALAPLRAAQLTRAWNRLRILPNIGYVVGLAALVALDRLTVSAGLAVLLVANLGTAVACTLLVRRLERRSGGERATDIAEVRSFGRRLTLASLPQQLAPRVDQLVLPLLVSPTALGVYAVAAALAQVVLTCGVTLEQVLFPRAVAQRMSAGAVTRVLAIVAGVAAAGSVLLALVAEPLIRWVYGADYVGADVAVPVILAAAVVRVVAAGLAAVTKAAGGLTALTVANWVGVAVTLGLLPLLADHGLAAVAAANLAGAVATTAVLLVAAARRGNGSGQWSEEAADVAR